MIDLFEEELLKPKKKKTIKPTTILLITIIILSILLIVAFVLVVYLKGTILTITLDGQDAKSLESLLIMEENNKIYMPIRRMAQYLKYEDYSGDYITLSEDDTTKCYIKTPDEIVSFTLNSNILTKVIDGQSQQVKITEPIKEINGELCISAEGAQDAFNFKFYYDVKGNDIYIQTLSYLYSWYSNAALDLGYLQIDEEIHANKTAVLDDMLIVKGENNLYGVISTIQKANGEIETILETKYDSIEYFRKSAEFLVGSNNKKGIISKDRKTKLELSYDSIERVTNKNDTFYVVGKSNLYGLLDQNGKIVIYPEYEQIGMDVSAYSQNGVTNGYILHNELIPVRRNQKWGLVNTEGKKVVDFVYDSFGCPSAKNSFFKTYGVIELLDYNLMVGRQGEKYNLIDSQGKGSDFIFDSIYIIVSEGKSTYYASVNGETKELTTLLQDRGVIKNTITSTENN